MEADYWKQRWQEGQIGFHQERVTPLLEQHWGALHVRRDATVFVPLAGKSRDMDWLLEQGHRVVGVELSELAVQQYFSERGLEPGVRKDRNGIYHRSGDLVLLLGDAFALDDALLASFDAIYDRAALIALPTEMREQYADRLYAHMPTGCESLLITLEYPQHEKEGPPFSVEASEVHSLFSRHWRIDQLEFRDILAEQPGFVAEGVTALTTTAWRLQRR
jgi:thiopurine S-methyltransferase